MQAYLDNSATTRVQESVVRAINKCMLEEFYNPSALYAPAVQVEKQILSSRELTAGQVHATAARVIFTSGGTEADNLAILSILGDRRGGRVLFSAGEHPAVRAACESLQGHFDVREIPYDASGLVRLDSLEQLLSPDTRLICVMQVNNETGAVMPLKEIISLRDKLCPDALLHVDGVQGFLRIPTDMRMGIDTYALSGHKIHGPKGIGALVCSERARIIPRMLGGGQEKNLRSGTENVPGIIGLAQSISDYPDIRNVQQMKMRLCDGLREIAGKNFFINGPQPESPLAAPHILNCSQNISSMRTG